MINIAELIGDPDFCQPNGINITRTTVRIENFKQVENSIEMKLVGIITVDNENEDDAPNEIIA